MTEITPKNRGEGQRGYIIHTRSWERLIDFYRDLISKGQPHLSMLRIVEAIAHSSVSEQLHGATSMDTLLLSDCPNFRSGDSTLRISYHPDKHLLHFEHHSFSGRDDRKSCAESEAMQTLRLFLRLKYGVLFEIP